MEGYGGGYGGFGDMGGGFMGAAEEQKKSGEKKVGHHQPSEPVVIAMLTTIFLPCRRLAIAKTSCL